MPNNKGLAIAHCLRVIIFASVVKFPAAKKGRFLPSQWRNFFRTDGSISQHSQYMAAKIAMFN
jgi:hypothetical protein